mgnify:FL=1
MLDVSFSFFDPQPQDYHSIKLLLSQLVQGDAAALDLGGVADLVLEQKLVGSTVKTDGGDDDDKAAEGDPYAVLTVLNLNVHKVRLVPVLLSCTLSSLGPAGGLTQVLVLRPQEHKALSALTSYLLAKVPASSPFHTELSNLLARPAEPSTAASPKHVGLVLSERLVNMPAQIVPPMYKMLDEELQWARDEVRRSLSADRLGGARAQRQPRSRPPAHRPHRTAPRARSLTSVCLALARPQNEPYHFSHLLFLSRVFRSTAADLDSDPNAALEAALVAEASMRAAVLGGPKKKKGRKGAAPGEAGSAGEDKLWVYHAEDEAVEKVRLPLSLSVCLSSSYGASDG